MNKKIALLLILLVTLSASPTFQAKAQESEGNISFQPSVMPEIDFSYNSGEYTFDLTWKTWYITIKPFAIYEGKELTLKQIIPWLKNNYPNVDYRWAIHKFKNYHRWGFYLEKLPENVANNLDYVGFDLEDTNIPLDRFEIEEVEYENGTFKRIHIANRFTFDFYDLIERGFTFDVVGRRIIIGNVKGKTDLDIDPITYSAPTITVTGYTEGSPCTFLDIWNEDKANGWNVTCQTCENSTLGLGTHDTQFLFNATIVIGDGSTATWFADTNKQVVFVDGLGSPLIRVRNNAHFRIGEVVDAGDKTSKNGCMVLSLDDTSGTQHIISCDSGSDLGIYSSSINAQCSTDKYRYIKNIGIVWNTVFNWVTFYTDLAGADIYHVMLNDGTLGLYNLDDATIDTIFITDMNVAIYIAGAGNYYFYNVFSRNPASGFVRPVSITGNSYIIDADTDEWTFWWGATNTGKIYRQYTFNVMVVDNVGSPVQDANITLYNADTSVAFVATTAANGSIAEQTVSRGYYAQATGDTLNDYGPFRLHVDAEDFADYDIFNITLDGPVNWTLSLEPEAATGFGMNLVLMVVVILSVFIVAKRR